MGPEWRFSPGSNNTYFTNHLHALTSSGYDPFLVKSEILLKINSLWSIDNQEFIYQANDLYQLGFVRFKEYDKLGFGGFSTIYRGKNNTVYKVLHQSEKSSVSSVTRFKREFDLMEMHNNSGYTIRVFDFDGNNLIYRMEQAICSLEDYVDAHSLTEQQKDQIIIRCVECMEYLHKHKIIHRDFHPGNILQTSDKKWVITDFGLAKSICAKYTRATNSTREVGRIWFTDPIQIEALKDGSELTDIYSLAKTIDYIFNGDKSQRINKYSSVIHRATSPDYDARYNDIAEFASEIKRIINRHVYVSPKEMAINLLDTYFSTEKINLAEFAEIMQQDEDGALICELVLDYKNDFVPPFINLGNLYYDLAENCMKRLSTYLTHNYLEWKKYDVIAWWGAGILRGRPGADDGIATEAVNLVEHVAGSANRFSIKTLANQLKNDTTINQHIRGLIPYYEGY